jgi:hypothetical protein
MSNKKIFVSQSELENGRNRSESVCNHYSYCKSPHKFSMKCDYPMDCNIKRFYDKYNKNLNKLGIGSLV